MDELTPKQVQALQVAVALLREVHTDTDFECECWEASDKLADAFGIEDDDDNF